MAKNPRKGKHFKCVRFKHIKVNKKRRKVCADYQGKGGWYKERPRHRSAAKRGEDTRCTNFMARRPELVKTFFGL